METLFTTLSEAVKGSAIIAISAAVLWGILSVLLSPCHLAGIPLIVGYISKDSTQNFKRAFAVSVLFGFGVLITIGLIGGLTAVAGSIMGSFGKYGNYIFAVVFFILGLYLMEVIHLPWTGFEVNAGNKKNLIGAFFLGVLFGSALGPCTFAYMAPVLGVVFNIASSNLIFALALLFAFSVGHCGVLVLAGVSLQIVQKYVNWSNNSQTVRIIKIACGICVILGGVWLIYTAP
ncbi:MAG: cytochrome C biogenesis protein [Verrucomicrobiae bacterium]|nr:cytochrome C biogenesis protein [Verrucomicrobiae bacterium]